MSLKHSLKRLWAFLQKDTLPSWSASLIILIILIKFVLFPFLAFITSSPLPLVVVESCSMYHQSSFDNWWEFASGWYIEKSITKTEFKEYPLKNGLNKGDIIFVWGRSKYRLGDVVIFEPNSDSTAKHPIIHRIVSNSPIGTKGDNFLTNSRQLTTKNNPNRIDETSIPEERIIGKAAFRVPLLGWIKLIFFEPFRPVDQRGLC